MTNTHVVHIHDYVTHVKKSAEVRERYMTIGEIMDRSKAEGLMEGEQIGRKNIMVGILAELGPIPGELQERLDDIDEGTLIQWVKLAARVENIQEFMEQV